MFIMIYEILKQKDLFLPKPWQTQFWLISWDKKDDIKESILVGKSL